MKVTRIAVIVAQLAAIKAVDADLRQKPGIEDIDFSPVPQRRQLAPSLNIVRTVASSSQPLYGANKATDGNLFTPWESNPDDMEWIYVQFNGVQGLDEVILNWQESFAIQYDVQVSNDKSTWRTVVPVRNGKGGEEKIKLPSGTSGKYLRIYGIKRVNKIHGYTLLELSVTGSNSAVLIPNPNQDPAIVEVKAILSEDGNVPENAIDGNFDTRWASKRGNDDDWIYVKFDRSYPLGLVVFSWEVAFGEDYNVQVSNNGKNWKTVVKMRDRTGGVDVIELPRGTTGRYVRMKGIKRGSKYGYSLYGITVKRGIDAIELPKAVTAASSYEEPNKIQYATDGNFNTRWASIRGRDNEWLGIDYGFIAPFTRITFRWEVAFAKKYKIQTSYDGSKWKTALTVTNGKGGVEAFDLPPGTTGRAIRMYGISRATKYGYSLWEMIVERGAESIPQPTSRDLQIVSTLASSSKSGSYNANMATDAKLETRWESDANDNEWIVVSFDRAYTLARVVLIWANAFGKNYNVQIPNGNGWRNVVPVRNENGGVDAIDLPQNTVANKLRIKGRKRGTRDGYSLHEITVQGF